MNFNVVINAANPPAVIETQSNGTPIRQIAYAAEIPQGCRADHNPAPAGPPYGTPEWIKHIILTKNAADVKKVKDHYDADYPALANSDPNSEGCGHISMNVIVYSAAVNGGVVSPPLRIDNNNYYSLVAKVDPHPPHRDGPWTATEIWICAQDFDHNLPQYQEALKRPHPPTKCA